MEKSGRSASEVRDVQKNKMFKHITIYINGRDNKLMRVYAYILERVCIIICVVPNLTHDSIR